MTSSSLLRLLVTRVVLAVVSLLVVSFVIFWCVEMLPGDTAERMLGRDATPEALARLRAELGLDRPGLERYWMWLGATLTGDLGQSLVANRPVVDWVATRAGNTLTLSAFALAIYIPLALLLGLLSAAFRGRTLDSAISVAVLLGMCLPEFVTGLLLVSIFAITFEWFPPLALIDQANSFGDLLHILFLPALTLAIAMTAYAVRMMRDNLIEVLDSQYVRLATLKGLGRRQVLMRHALPNALGPAVNVTALNIAWLIGGIVVVETVFNFPGLGRLLIDAISLKDVPVIQAVALLLTALYILVNLLADIVVILLNPRLRAGA